LKAYIITFKNNIDVHRFENILKSHYYKSKLKVNTHIIFDLTKTEWFESFQLSLLTLWTKELINRGKHIKYLLPSSSKLHDESTLDEESLRRSIENRKKVRDFLNNCRFINFLKNENIDYDDNLKGGKHPSKTPAINKDISPFVFFANYTGYTDFMERLENQYELVFNDFMQSSVVSSKEIKEIVIKECFPSEPFGQISGLT